MVFVFSQVVTKRCALHRARLSTMKRITLLAALALATSMVVLPAASAKTRTLVGTTGPGFTITLTEKGKRVTTLSAGTYRFRITDKSGMHDFALRGPGLNRKLTGVAYTGTKTVTVRLKKGRYTFFCTPHPDSMRGTFRVR